MPKRKLQEALDNSKEVSEQLCVPFPDNTSAVDGQPPGTSDARLLSCSANGSGRTHVPSAPSTSATDVSCEQPSCKRKKSVRFSGVTVYLFPRTQGFTCVPSSGGVTLGMTHEHSAVKNFSLAEHEQECRTSRTQYLIRRQQVALRESDEESPEEEEDEEEDEDDENGEESEEAEDAYSFPVAISIRQRRNLLKEAGCPVDTTERNDCQSIRNSREACGCQCQNVCNPAECSCSLGQINCQVDRYSYPCGCTKEGCQNAFGRIEFNPTRVKTHYLTTISRITMSGNLTMTDISQEYGSYNASDATTTPASSTGICNQRVEPYVQTSQCDYAYTSLQSANSYPVESEAASVSMIMNTYTNGCQTNYDYYHMQPVSTTTISDNPGVDNEYLSSNEPGTCFYRNTANCMISPVMEFSSSEELPVYPATLPSISFVNLSSRENDLNGSAYLTSSPSEGTSGDSSSPSVSTGTLDFGELIKQSLVETVTA
ncbi:cysteine/serine-rich nuclear protein 3-like isoform X2 [Paramacrobiotus metropolitanus]|uniref:cysteine/serine-rich nuclear protein 3-like isoform X2 n=1 Tax=Paramacrobiotus metropolitanus TaxID=2943436 RepID=UPI002445B752|nr:cysteine/serine-rich nuclear protein 3-like isoform X2 [Paramacrobiotus metropolitanus]